MSNGTPFLLDLFGEDILYSTRSMLESDVFKKGFMTCRLALIDNGVIHLLDDEFSDDIGYHIELLFHMTKNRFFTIIVLWVYDPDKAFELKMRGVPMLEKPLRAKKILKKHRIDQP